MMPYVRRNENDFFCSSSAVFLIVMEKSINLFYFSVDEFPSKRVAVGLYWPEANTGAINGRYVKFQIGIATGKTSWNRSSANSIESAAGGRSPTNISGFVSISVFFFPPLSLCPITFTTPTTTARRQNAPTRHAEMLWDCLRSPPFNKLHSINKIPYRRMGGFELKLKRFNRKTGSDTTIKYNKYNNISVTRRRKRLLANPLRRF